MISKDTIERMAKTTVDSLARQGVRDYTWDDRRYTSDSTREAYRKAMRDVAKELGAKVEGEPE